MSNLYEVFRRVTSVALVAAFCGLPLAAASSGAAADEQESLTRALEYLQQGNSGAAIVELKNAVQANPASAPARAMLGEVYLRTGDVDSAIKELERARDLGQGDDRTRLLLAEARLQIADYQAVINEIGTDQPMPDDLGAGLVAARGQALFGLGRFDEAQAALEQVVLSHPIAAAYAGLARLALYRGDAAAAGRQVAAGLGRFPDDAQLQLMRAEQFMQARDFEAARAAFEKLSGDGPADFIASVGLARAELALGRTEAARVVIDDLYEQQPGNVAITLLRGAAALQARDYIAAQQDANAVRTVDPDNAAALYIEGAAGYGLEQYEQALKALVRYFALVPGDITGRKLLAATQVRMGDAEGARKTLGTDIDAADPEYLALLSTATALTGDFTAGLAYLEKAVAGSPEDARLRAQLGMLRIAAGDASQGRADLEQAVGIDPSLADDPRYDRAEILLIQGYLNERKFDDALVAIGKWREKHPDDATGLVMEGVAHAGKGDEAKGREAFTKALELRPGAADASANLAILDVRANQPEAAERVLAQVLDHHPDDLRTLVLLAQLSERTGERDKTRKWLERAVAAHPDNLPTRVFLSRLYFELQKPQEALDTVAPVLLQQPDNIAALEVQARAQLQTGRLADAVASYRRVIALAPGSAQAQFELAQAQAAQGDLAGSRAAAESAVGADPDLVAARVLLTRLQLRQNDAAAAEAQIATLQQTHPELPEITELRGDLAMVQGDPRAAAALFQEARKSQDVSRLAIAQARAQAASGDRAGATGTLETWVSANPSDSSARYELVRLYAAAGRKADVEAALRAIIDWQPDSWVARNDLAWMLYEKGELSSAQPLAERALELAPDNPAVMDTLGVILLERDETEKATALIRRASEGLPDNAEISLHLAEAYAKGNRKDLARQVLTALLGRQANFPGRDRAQALLAELGG